MRKKERKKQGTSSYVIVFLTSAVIMGVVAILDAIDTEKRLDYIECELGIGIDSCSGPNIYDKLFVPDWYIQAQEISWYEECIAWENQSKFLMCERLNGELVECNMFTDRGQPEQAIPIFVEGHGLIQVDFIDLNETAENVCVKWQMVRKE